MTKILLCSETFIKEHTNIDDNLSGAYLGPAIRETQDIELTEYLGSALVDKLCELVSSGTITETVNAKYKAILDQAQYFLAYSSIAKVIPIASIKVANFGATQSQDENIRTLGIEDLSTVTGWYQKKADTYAKKLMRYVLSVKSEIPELNECAAGQIKSHLNSAASTGLFLGGSRGRKLGSGGSCCGGTSGGHSGGGGEGSVVTWEQTVTGGTKIATITIDGKSTEVFVPEGISETVQYLTEDTWTGAYWEIGTELPEGGSWGASIRRPDYTEIFETYQRQNEVIVMGEGNIGNTGSREGNLSITDGNDHIMLDGQGNRYVFRMDFSNGILYFYHSPDQAGSFYYEGAQGKSHTTGETSDTVHIELAKVLSGDSWVQKDEMLFPKSYFIDNMTTEERVALYNLIKYSGPKVSPISKFCRFFSTVEKDGFLGMCEVYFCRFDSSNRLSFSGSAISRNSDILIKVKFDIANDGNLYRKTITEYSLTVNS